MGDTRFETWGADAIARRWAGARIDKIAPLKGDLSTRRFWRVWITSLRENCAPSTAIIVDLGPDDLPRYVRALNLLPAPPSEPPWINVHRFLTSLGAPIPELYDSAPESRAMLVEDVGEVSLHTAAHRPDANVADLFRLATEELLRLHVDGTLKVDDRCIARAIAYDERLFDWEMKEFREIGLATVAPVAALASIEPELALLAKRLGSYPRVFSHRDYHRENLFIQDGSRIRMIDFQDALMAPAAQDLAVMLTTRDTGDAITPATERRILDFYHTGLARRGAATLAHPEFITSYRLCVLQHALKMIGRFEKFERDGKTGYSRYIPHALAQARRMLAEMRPQFPQLCAALMPTG
jgi:aminoglycoside/choline kinase family phosphotransferase